MKAVLLFALTMGLAVASVWARPEGPTGGRSNVQQPVALPAEPLPEEPVKPGEKPEIPVLPEELPLRPGELSLRPTLEGKPQELRRPFEEKRREMPRYKLQLALDAMQPVLPPLDTRLAGASLASTVRVSVKKIEFEGNRVFSKRQLAKVVAAYSGREVTSEELEEARVALTKHYVDAGYINSGALLPDQDVSSGVIKFQIVEGRLTEIDLYGNFWYRRWWLLNQLRRAAGRSVNFNNLKVGLQLLRQNPTISRLNAELKPGVKAGESILEVAVKDAQPFRGGFTVSNSRPPSVGEGIGEFYLADLNLTGQNDPVGLRWGLVRWTIDGEVDYTEYDNVSGTYEIPVTPWDTMLAVHASKSDSSIIDETFAALGITSRSTEIGLALRQPLYQALNNIVTASLSVDRKHSETFLLGRPFTLSLGAIEGESDVFATRFALDWVNRSQVHVLALRSVFSLGLYGFGSTRADPRSAGATTLGAGNAQGFEPEIPDSKFFSWLGQAQYVRRIFDTKVLRKKPEAYGWNLLRETLLVLRVNGQLSDEPLLSLEQFSIGGMQSVRGYRENQLLRDNGVLASAELRVPVWLAKDKSPIVSIAPFFDWGSGWNVNKVGDNYLTVYSAGVGLLVNATRHAQATIYWGHPFVDFNEKKVSLQDYGLHFAISINAL